MNRRAWSLVLVGAVALPLGGCYQREIAQGNPLGWIMRILSGDFNFKSKTLSTVDTKVDVDLVASAGGLANPTYDITLNDPGGGTFGHFAGTAVIKRGRFVSLKDDSSADLFSTVTNIVQKALGETVTLDKVKAKVSAYQTPGGVEAHWKIAVSFSGGFNTGANAGKVIKGKITGEGVDP